MRLNTLMIDAVLFDMDGVVMDTRDAIESAWRKGAALFGREISKEEFDMCIHGRTGNETLDLLFGELNRENKVLLKKFVDDAEEGESGRLMPGVYEFLRYLSEKNIAIGLVTSSWNDRVNFLTEEMAVSNFFIARVTREDVKHGKPNPECYLRATSELKSMGFIADNVLVFEDSVSGINSARGAGCQSIGVTYSDPACAIRLLEAGAKAVIGDFTSRYVRPISCRKEGSVLVEVGELILEINSNRHLMVSAV